MSSREEPKKKRTGLIVGLIIGGIILIIIIAIVIWLLFLRDTGPGSGGGDAIACASDADCILGLRCNLTSNSCVPCVENSDCTSPIRSFCQTNPGLCVGCIENTDCPEGESICNPDDFTCYQCLSDTDCESTPLTPFCTPPGAGSCVQCRFNQHCAEAEVCTNNVCV